MPSVRKYVDGQYAIGHMFRNWKVIDNIVSRDKTGKAQLLVECKCGYKAYKPIYMLTHNRTSQCQSCAAILGANSISNHKPIEIGDVFGTLCVISVVFYKLNNGTGYNTAWCKCQCKCGRIKDMRVSVLRRPDIVSCGMCKTIGNISGCYFSKLQAGAKRRGLEFSDLVTPQFLQDLLIKQNNQCALSGCLLQFNVIRKLQSASVDRIDSSKGYTIDNIQIVSKDINNAKQAKSDADFIQLCREVVKYADSK